MRHQTLPTNILTLLEDNTWWQMIEELESHLLPFMAILNHLQRDVARLSDVLHAFAYFMQLYKHGQDDFSKNMVRRLESRWKQWEQPLLIIAFFLHPKYRGSVFNSNLSSLNLPQIGLWVQYYYKEWFKTRPSVILAELSKFVNEEYPFDNDTASNFDDVQDYWKFTTGATKELSILAVRVFSICVNSASCERLFSSMDFIHSVRRNRLQVRRV